MLDFFVSGLIVGSDLALITVGVALIYNTTRVFHFAHGLVVVLSAYTAYTLNSAGLPLWLAAIAAVPVAMAAGMLCEAPLYRAIRARHGGPLALFTASFGLLVIGTSAVQIVWGPTPRRYDIAHVGESFHFFGARVTTLELVTVATALVLLVAAGWVLSRSRVGLRMRAVASNLERAHLLGLRPKRVYLMTFALGSALAVPGAVLHTARFGVEPQVGLRVILLAVVALILAGIGNTAGAIVSAYLVGLVSTVPLQYIDPRWSQTLVFLVLLAVLLVRPTGIFGETQARRYEMRSGH